MDKRSLLLIEDDEIVREAIGDILDLNDISVIMGGDGAEGVSLFETHKEKVNLVILDMIMPKLNGYEALQKLREIDPEIPVIMASGHNDAAAKAETYRHQPNGYLTKPFEIEDLLNTVKPYF